LSYSDIPTKLGHKGYMRKIFYKDMSSLLKHQPEAQGRLLFYTHPVVSVLVQCG